MRLRIATNKRVETTSSSNKRQGSKTEMKTSQKKPLGPKINPNSLNTSKRENISKSTPLLWPLTKNLKEITPIKNIMKSRKTRQAIKRRTTITMLHLPPPKPEPNSNLNPSPKTTIHTGKLAELQQPQEMPLFTTLMRRWHRIWSSRLSLPLNSTEITTLHFLVA